MAKIKLIKKYKVAEEVLEILKTLSLNCKCCKGFCEVTITTFENGRENGLCFYALHQKEKTTKYKDMRESKYVYVRENRCSNDIVITKSKGLFGYKSVTETEYEDSEYYAYNEKRKVAKRVLELMLDTKKVII